ncbi:SRPBCC family protein [Compostibacter hankyongensis]|uniref:Polyketide cyclase / dehydrase and lipid transport n=1 Tax=Compostibacter hankyongensis TaxID=1007089 RepID=A0ABP8FRC2_9BACT
MPRILKLFLFGIVSLVILLALISLILPRTVRIERAAYVEAEPREVFAALNELKGYPAWNPWCRDTAGVQLHFSPLTHGVGARYSWTGRGQSGGGSYTITGSRPDSLLEYRMEVTGLPPLKGQFNVRAVPGGTGSRIRWTVFADAGWRPWWRFWVSMADRLFGPAVETGLNKLKQVCER